MKKNPIKNKSTAIINLRQLLVYTLIYALAALLMILLLNNNTLSNDTDRLLDRVDRLKASYLSSRDLTDNVTILDAKVSSEATQSIRDGAPYTRQLSGSNLKLTVPIYENGRLLQFMVLSDSRTPTLFPDSIVVALLLVFYIFHMTVALRRQMAQKNRTDNLVAKIKNIERSPMTQSYLITKEDDQATIALNHLGETIQAGIASSKEVKQNLYEFIEFFQFPIFVYDAKGGIHRINAAFENEFSRAKTIDLFSPYPDFLKFLVDKMVNPDIQSKTFYFSKINSHYHVQFNPLDMIQNRYLVTMTDVTQYQQVASAHREFISNVSGELKNPLIRIEKTITQLIEIPNLPSQAKNLSLRVRQDTDRLIGIVSDTLELTDQNPKVKKVKVRPKQIIEDILKDFFNQTTNKNLQVKTDLSDLTLTSDPTSLHLIFKNLIENAILYTPSGGKITLLLQPNGKKTYFSISDTGQGLTPLQKSRIFERFYQTDTGNQSNEEGTGLGLALVEKKVTDLKGSIRVQSESGQGSTFIVLF